jgi:anti-repressor protein
MLKKVIIEALGKDYANIHQFKRDGKVWYRAKDLCAILGIKNVSLAVNGNPRIGYFGVEARDITRLNGKPGCPLYLSEAGVYKLILKSRKPIAYRIKVLLSVKVLPEIMKTGNYVEEDSRRHDNSPGQRDSSKVG